MKRVSEGRRPCTIMMDVSFSGYSILTRRKPNKYKSFSASIFFREGRPQLFYGKLLAWFILSTVWQSLVEFRLPIFVCEAWQWSRKQNLCRVDKTVGPILSRFRKKFMTFWDSVGDPSEFPMHLPNCVYRISFRRYRPSKLPLSCEIGARFLGGRYTPHFGHAFSNRTYNTSEHVAGFGWVPFSELEGLVTKKEDS